MLQRKEGAVDVDKLDWKDAVDLAEKNAKDEKTKSTALEIYKKLVVRAAQKVTVKGTLKGETLTVESLIPAK